jgi:hypothetical protein
MIESGKPAGQSSYKGAIGCRYKIADKVRVNVFFKENLSNFWTTTGISIIKVLYDEFRKMAITGLLISSK